MKGSNIAREIDQDYKSRTNEYTRTHCKKCANKNTQLCHIVIRRDGRADCVYYEEK